MSTHVFEKELIALLQDHVKHPYAQYTEHGVHAYFIARLYNALPLNERYLTLPGQGRVCRVQKEYPTPKHLDKSRRQGWDVCLLRSPYQPSATADVQRPLFDRLDTEAIVEFGLNASHEHLVEDVRRLAHKDVRSDLRFIAHLMRASGPRAADRLSLRDCSVSDSRSKAFRMRDRILVALDASTETEGAAVTVFLCIPERNGAEIWKLTPGNEERLPLG